MSSGLPHDVSTNRRLELDRELERLSFLACFFVHILSMFAFYLSLISTSFYIFLTGGSEVYQEEQGGGGVLGGGP